MYVNMMSPLLELTIALIAFLFAITIHEFSHAFIANLLGDDTAKRFGRLSLNPFVHIDLIGLLFLILLRIGWARPVPMDIRNFKYPRFYSVLTGFAGPLANLISALFFLYCLEYIPVVQTNIVSIGFAKFFTVAVQINVMLGVFNMIPLPPLDGSHLLYALIPRQWHRFYYMIIRYSLLILLIFLSLPIVQLSLLKSFVFVTEFLKQLVV